MMGAGEDSPRACIHPSDVFSLHPGPFVGAFPHVEPSQVSYSWVNSVDTTLTQPLDRRVLPTSAQNKVSFFSREQLVDYFGAKTLPEGL